VSGLPSPEETAARRRAFKALHERPGIFVMPNPWDAGTAKLLADMGFEALATASAALAATMGVPDSEREVGRFEAISHATTIARATGLPVNADLERGFGDAPERVADTVKAAITAGLAGCSIEDNTGKKDVRLYDIGLATDRIRAAREAIDQAGVEFVLTARAECFLTGHDDPLNEAIRRLQAYERAGADVAYAPGLTKADQIGAIVGCVGIPVNVLGGTGPAPPTVAELGALGVKRVSLGPRLFQAALGAFLSAARELRETGSFGFTKQGAALGPIYDIFRQGDGP
jgi:2-methylisocitrate lyase-like PEP mutase family enzyme